MVYEKKERCVLRKLVSLCVIGGIWYRENGSGHQRGRRLEYWSRSSSCLIRLDFNKFVTGGYKEMSSILADQLRPRPMSPNTEGEGGVAGSQPMSTAVHRSPNELDLL